MEYLQKALDLLRVRAYYSRNVDWNLITTQANAFDIKSPIDCYAIIRMATEALQDNHSFFVDANKKHSEGPQGKPLGYGLFILSPEFVVIEVFPDSAGDQAGISRGDVIETINGSVPIPQGRGRLVLNPDLPQRIGLHRGGHSWEVEIQPAPVEKAPMPQGCYLGDGIGYLELFVQGNPTEAQNYIDTAQNIIRKLASKGACGWIVDLRCDRGGNMWPMFSGVGALLGDGFLGEFIDADGSKTQWFYHSGVSSYLKNEMNTPVILNVATNPVPTFDPGITPVAILTSEFTSSSGEMTLISFRGRPNTRTFGSTTSGEITGVAIHELEDGALLGIAESIAADRTGHEYHTAIEPDEPLQIDWFRYGKEDDPVIGAAKAWLRTKLP